MREAGIDPLDPAAAAAALSGGLAGGGGGATAENGSGGGGVGNHNGNGHNVNFGTEAAASNINATLLSPPVSSINGGAHDDGANGHGHEHGLGAASLLQQYSDSAFSLDALYSSGDIGSGV